MLWHQINEDKENKKNSSSLEVFFFFSPQVGEQKRSIKSKFFFCSKRNLNAVILLSRDSHYD